MPSSKFDIAQSDCLKETFEDHPGNFPTCSIIPQNNAVTMPWD